LTLPDALRPDPATRAPSRPRCRVMPTLAQHLESADGPVQVQWAVLTVSLAPSGEPPGNRTVAATGATDARADAMGSAVLVAGPEINEPTSHDLGPRRVRRKSARRPQLAHKSQRPSIRIHAGQEHSRHDFGRSEAPLQSCRGSGRECRPAALRGPPATWPITMVEGQVSPGLVSGGRAARLAVKPTAAASSRRTPPR
jgi:hypothetical protein